jgi:hypothetical protein
MKVLRCLGVLILALAASTSYGQKLKASSPHTATFTWTASVDGGSVSLYRASSACSATPTSFTVVQSGLPAAGPAADSTVTAGAWCYYVTTTVQGLESAASNKITITVLPQPPAGLAGAVD